MKVVVWDWFGECSKELASVDSAHGQVLDIKNDADLSNVLLTAWGAGLNIQLKRSRPNSNSGSNDAVLAVAKTGFGQR